MKPKPVPVELTVTILSESQKVLLICVSTPDAKEFVESQCGEFGALIDFGKGDNYHLNINNNYDLNKVFDYIKSYNDNDEE